MYEVKELQIVDNFNIWEINLLRIDVICFLRVAKYRCITKLYTSLHRLHVYLILVSITADVEPCITWMISGASVF